MKERYLRQIEEAQEENLEEPLLNDDPNAISQQRKQELSNALDYSSIAALKEMVSEGRITIKTAAPLINKLTQRLIDVGFYKESGKKVK